MKCHTRALPDLWPRGERVEIPFEGITLPGVLRLLAHAAGAKGGAPVVILVAGLDSTKEEFYTLEAEIHQRGLATLAFDGPAQGERSNLPLRPDFEAAVSAVLDFLASEGRVNSGRIGALGVSCGGYYAPRSHAADSRLAAAVGVAGFYDLAECWADLPALKRQRFSVSFGNLSEEEAGERAKEISLQGILGGVDRPLLIIHGAKDRLCPVGDARRIVEEAGAKAELVVYFEGDTSATISPFSGVLLRPTGWPKNSRDY